MISDVGKIRLYHLLLKLKQKSAPQLQRDGLLSKAVNNDPKIFLS